MVRQVRRFLILSFMAPLMAACASSGAAPAAQHNTLAAEEIARVGDVSLYDALRQLRPQFLRSRTVQSAVLEKQEVTVYLGGMQMMEGLEHLREVAAKNVREVQFLEPQQANARFGGRNNGGALVVIMK